MATTVYCSAACVPAPLAERWDNLVEYTDGCWLWSGATNAEGYGVIREGDRMVLAHRVSLRLKLDVPDFDGFACHTCNNRRCVNPAHLYIGTHDDNMRDMSVDNTGSGSKTDWETRRRMVLDFYASGDVSAVAAAYGVSKKTVRRWATAMGPDAIIPRPRRSPFADASSD